MASVEMNSGHLTFFISVLCVAAVEGDGRGISEPFPLGALARERHCTLGRQL